MLRLTLSQGEYFTVDGRIVVQLHRVEGGRAHVAVQAPREIPIVRGEVLERAGGKRPDGLINTSGSAPRGKWVFWDQSKLSCIGRDIEYRELTLERNAENVWEMISDSMTQPELLDDRIVYLLSELMCARTKFIGTPTELSEKIDPVGVEFVDKYIDKIFAAPQADGSMCLQIKVFTGETTEKCLANLRGRTGHTFKKMIPMRTARFERADRTAAGHSVEVTYRAGLCV